MRRLLLTGYYANAHNIMFETNISQVAILMVDRDLMYKNLNQGK